MSNLLQKFNTCIRVKYTHVENAGSYAIERNGDKLTLYFQKSNGLRDWWNNFNFPAKPYRDMDNLWFCHRGFLKVWKSIEPYVAPHIADKSVTIIEIIGYSHGGAIGQLCYEYVKFNRPDVLIKGYGFGSPRVLWGTANQTVKDRFKGFVVIRNGQDLITHLPPACFGFTHVPAVLKVSTGQSNMKLVKDAVKRCSAFWGKVGKLIVSFIFNIVIPIYDHFPSRYRKALKRQDENNL